MDKTCDVLIVGDGIVGLSCYRHLQKQGVRNVLVATDPSSPRASGKAAGFVIAGLQDNFTRLAHAHGSAFGESLWKYSVAGFEALLHFCTENRVPAKRNDHLRLLVSDHEVKEATKAVEALSAFRETELKKSGLETKGYGNRVLAIQKDPGGAAVLEVEGLLRSLKPQSESVPKVIAIQSHGTHIRSKTTSGDVVSEIVVLANHLAINELVPELSSALVSFADQWTTLEFEEGLPQLLSPGLFFTANHTHEWGCVAGPRRVRMGGARYLRPMAGIEAKEARVEEKISSHLKAKFHETFTNLPESMCKQSSALLDCRPCDELPIIGPMYGTNRVLLATGFMGAGLGLGFKAGASLASLIQTGSCPDLPRRLWPERLRSLES